MQKISVWVGASILYRAAPTPSPVGSYSSAKTAVFLAVIAKAPLRCTEGGT